MSDPITAVALHSERDVVTARQRARDIAAELGFDRHDQTRIATAVSEIARNAVSYARDGRVEFHLESAQGKHCLAVHISDRGPGIGHLDEVLGGRYVSKTGMGQGILGARRLMDGFEIRSNGEGTTVRLRKELPRRTRAVPPAAEQIARGLERREPRDVFDELRHENQELLQALEELRRRQEETSRLNGELEETNRGVVALYAELDERAEQLKRADQTKSRFLSHVSHEFRTPLNSILALSRLLLGQSDGPLTPEQQKQVAFIRQSADTLLEMVNDLLDLARVESGRTELSPAHVDIANIFGTLRGMMRPLLSDGVALVFEDPAGVPPLYTDEAKLAQILRNFVSNALKFTPKGEVRVKAAPAADGESTIISVSDTGIGIAPEDQERIFQEFVQVPNALQAKAKGTGLGLPLARKLTELLGGKIEVESRPGEGSVFSIRLPRKWQEQPAAAAAPPKPRILIIDDEEIARYLLRQSLAAPGDCIDEASNGAEGVAKALSGRPAAIFLDLIMPGMSGGEVLKVLQADPATRPIPVLIITSKKLTDADIAELAPAAAVLSKELLSRPNAAAEIRRVLAGAGVDLSTRKV